MVTDEIIYDQTFTLNLLESPNNPQKKSYLLYKLFKQIQNKQKIDYSGMRTYTPSWITVPAFYKMNSNVCRVK